MRCATSRGEGGASTGLVLCLERAERNVDECIHTLISSDLTLFDIDSK